MPTAPVRCLLALAVAATGISGCVTVDNTKDVIAGSAQLVRSDGTSAGEAQLRVHGARLLLRVTAEGLSPGPHGLHLHGVGRCDPPDFASAQGHWNPTARQHGSDNPAGPHAGDVPNLAADSQGRGSLEVELNDQASAGGLASLFDADGTAVVIHAGPDDLRTDPSGASGGRIACGVLARR